jgi:4-alpha-glucanotransferase
MKSGMKQKVIATINPRELKIIIPVFAAVSPVLNAEGRETKMGTFRSWYDQIIQLYETVGINIVGVLPITQQHGSEASPFSTDAYGLNHYYTYLPDLPEVLSSQLLTQKAEPMYVQVGTQGRQDIDHITYRTLHDEITKAASEDFFNHFVTLDAARKTAYEKFIKRNHFWLSNNAAFSVVQREMESRGLTPLFDSWPEEYQNANSMEVGALVREHPDDVRWYIYRQFIADEQYQRYKEDFKKRGIKIELNLPYGVSTEAGGTVWARQDIVFDTKWYVGCYAEPHNGYPEQNWKIYQYKEGPALTDFIREKFEYLSQYADIVFLDHLCGWSNKYLVPKGLRDDQLGTEDGTRPAQGHFEIPLYPTDRERSEEKYRHLDPCNATHKEQIMQIMEDNVYKMLKTIFNMGLEVGGETTGDTDRQVAVERALERLNKEGYEFRIMHVAPYKNWQGIYTTVPENTEFMATNHDQPTTWQILTNQRGTQKLWFADMHPHQIANYLTQVYRVFTSPNQIPLVPEQLTRTLGIYLLEQQAAMPSYLLTVPYNDLYALLYPDRLGDSTAVNLNEPGTSGCIPDGKGNWSVRIPNLDMTDPEVVRILNILQQREKVDYDPVVRLREYGKGWFTFGSSLRAVRAGKEERRKIIYFNPSQRQYTELTHPEKNARPVMELLISNISGHTNEGGVELTQELKKLLDPSKNYVLHDITQVPDDPDSRYQSTGQELLGSIYIKLDEGKDHHWIVYEDLQS